MKLLLCLLLLTCSAQAQQWWLVSSSKTVPLGHGAEHVIKQIAGPAKAELRLVFFDEKQCALCVVVNASQKAASPLNSIGLAENALAVCNGGYFNPGSADFSAVGLEIAMGVRSGKPVEDQWFGGLMVRQGRASLVLSHEFPDAADISDFVQCSPWLVEEGQICPVLNPGQDPRNRRTFIMTDGAGRWALGICNGVGLHELARILVTPGIITEMKVKRALNLDGGPSTGLWCRSADGSEHFQKPGWAVRNAIVVVPRDPK